MLVVNSCPDIIFATQRWPWAVIVVATHIGIAYIVRLQSGIKTLLLNYIVYLQYLGSFHYCQKCLKFSTKKINEFPKKLLCCQEGKLENLFENILKFPKFFLNIKSSKSINLFKQTCV
jgi:hypothetical protein